MKRTTSKRNFFLLLLLILVSNFINGQIPDMISKDLNKDGMIQPYEDESLPINKRVADLLSRLSLEEKTTLLIGTGMGGIGETSGDGPVVGSTDYLIPGAAGTTTPLERFGITGIAMTDGPAGVRIKLKRENDPNLYYSTAFPTGMVIASSWDSSVAEQIGKAMGNEALEYGSDIHLTPAVNIIKNPLCGRNFEYYSEDPLISGLVGAALSNGVESVGITASVKHYAVNNSESNRMEVSANLSQRALREIYLRVFQIMLQHSNPKTFMTSYNKINGVYASADYDLLTTILRGEWGYKGLVMTDWFGGCGNMKDIASGKAQSIAPEQIKAGNDLLMPGLTIQKTDIIESVNSGKLSVEDLNVCVSRVLTLVFNSMRFKEYKYSDSPDIKAHTLIARKLAAEGMILLKNEASTLPLSTSTNKVALFGVASYNLIPGGAGSGDVHRDYPKSISISLSDGLKNAGLTTNSKLEKLYTPFVKKEIEKLAEEAKANMFPRFLNMEEMPVQRKTIEEMAKTNDIAIITIGRRSGESVDRKVIDDFLLTATEQELLSNVSEVFHAANKKVVVLLNIGSAIETASWKDKADAILLTWLPGQEGGNAMSDILTGKINPSGKLTVTFPVKYEDIPFADEFPGTPKDMPMNFDYKEGIYVGYRYFDTFGVNTSYEFGYGLSYTTFDYSNIRISQPEFNKEMYVTVDVKNTGNVSGREIVELYLSAPQGEIDKPSKELKAYAKTKLLEPGQSQTIYMRLNQNDLASFYPQYSAWVADKGVYKIQIGASSKDIRQTKEFILPGKIVVEQVNNVMNNIADFEDLKP